MLVVRSGNHATLFAFDLGERGLIGVASGKLGIAGGDFQGAEGNLVLVFPGSSFPGPLRGARSVSKSGHPDVDEWSPSGLPALQRLFHPALAQLDAFGFLELFVEMAHVEVRILVAVQSRLDRTTKVLIRLFPTHGLDVGRSR